MGKNISLKNLINLLYGSNFLIKTLYCNDVNNIVLIKCMSLKLQRIFFINIPSKYIVNYIELGIQKVTVYQHTNINIDDRYKQYIQSLHELNIGFIFVSDSDLLLWNRYDYTYYTFAIVNTSINDYNKSKVNEMETRVKSIFKDFYDNNYEKDGYNQVNSYNHSGDDDGLKDDNNDGVKDDNDDDEDDGGDDYTKNNIPIQFGGDIFENEKEVDIIGTMVNKSVMDRYFIFFPETFYILIELRDVLMIKDGFDDKIVDIYDKLYMIEDRDKNNSIDIILRLMDKLKNDILQKKDEIEKKEIKYHSELIKFQNILDVVIAKKIELHGRNDIDKRLINNLNNVERETLTNINDLNSDFCKNRLEIKEMINNVYYCLNSIIDGNNK